MIDFIIDNIIKFILTYIINIIIIFLVVFRNARKIGYSGWLWSILSLLYYPLFLFYLLAGLPNRKLEQKRAEEMRLLKAQIEEARLRERKINSTIVSNRTIGDLGTISDDETID